MDPLPRIPGFTCTAVLGRGGMAVVYSAIDESLGRNVAIKVVTPHGPEGAGHVGRLEQEARGLAALQHPNIVELHSFGRLPDGALYYVMPLLEGGDLSSWRKPVPEEQLLPLLTQVLDALGHAHEEGLVHRDIKPANILFDRAGRPLLADFGAAFVRGTTRLTQHGMVVGSSHYMSPEQARGLEVDARSDLYSVGVLAFELLTGALPYDGPDDLAIALAKLEQPVPTLPPRFARWQPFFDRALALAPDARFQSAAEMRDALRFEAGSQPPRAPSRRAIIVAAAALLPVLAVLGAWLAPDGQDDRFSDPGGPELIMVPAGKDLPRMAVMAAPLDPQRYAQIASGDAAACEAAPSGIQGCVDHPEALRVAEALSQATGQAYRLPTEAEMAHLLPLLQPAPVRVWTSSCNERRVVQPQNIARRTWSGVRQLFGQDRLPAQVRVECDGFVTVPLGSVDGRTQLPTAVLLVREVGEGNAGSP